MAFQPRMHNTIEGFSIVSSTHRHSWDGIAIDLWNVGCTPGAGGYYIGEDPRLFITLETQGTPNRTLTLRHDKAPQPTVLPDQAISYVPAKMELWSSLQGIRFIRHLDLHFDLAALDRRFGEHLNREKLDCPRLMFSDERLKSLAALIAAECENPTPLHDLYSDGLALALLIDVLKLGQKGQEERKNGGLAPWQLRKATRYIEENCLRNIRLAELAELTGLSQSYFSQAFKASAGVPPHKWQMRARMDKVKTMLRQANIPLTNIAIAAGFADQAHFTRTFRKFFGVTPSAWQKISRD